MKRCWPAYAAAGWAFAFAALSVFWALGGRTGLHPLEQALGPLSLPLNLGAAVVKGVLGLLALATVARWRVSPRPLRGLLWVVAIVLLLYGLYEGVGNALVVSGLLDTGKPVTHWYWFYALIWGPYWGLGGILFLVTAIGYGDHARRQRAGPRT